MNFFKDESGQTILEYALIIAVLVLVVIVAFPSMIDPIKGVFAGASSDIAEKSGSW